MAKNVEFLFDIGSPFSYLASTQIEALAKQHGAALQLLPVALGGIFKATGAGQIPHPIRLSANKLDAERWARRYGVPFSWPASFPARTILAQRAILAAPAGTQGKAMHALFAAYWGEGKDVADPAVVKAALDFAGLDGAGLIARTEEPAIKDELRRNTDAAISRGAFGVPTFFVGDELFFGNDRLDFVAEALQAPGSR